MSMNTACWIALPAPANGSPIPLRRWRRPFSHCVPTDEVALHRPASPWPPAPDECRQQHRRRRRHWPGRCRRETSPYPLPGTTSCQRRPRPPEIIPLSVSIVSLVIDMTVCIEQHYRTRLPGAMPSTKGNLQVIVAVGSSQEHPFRFNTAEFDRLQVGDDDDAVTDEVFRFIV